MSQGYFFADQTPEQEALSRKQALADAILQHGMASPGSTPGAGLSNAGSSIIGALLTKRLGDKAKDVETKRESEYTRGLANLLGPSDNSTWDAGGSYEQGSFAPINVSPRVGAPLGDRLAATGNPDLIKQMGPQLAAQLMSQQAQANAPITPYQRANMDQQQQQFDAQQEAAQRERDESKRRFNVGESDKIIAGVDHSMDQLLAHERQRRLDDPAYKGEVAAAEEGAKLKAQNTAYGSDQGANPVVQSHVTNILNGAETMAQVPANLRNHVSLALTQQPKDSYSPLAATRFTNAASRITSQFTKMPQYELTAGGKVYLQRIDAALKHPGSVSDQDLLDSLTKLNTGGNAVTDAQVRLITDGKSLSDWAGTLSNKFQNGGVLSENQRKQIHDIANDIFANYKKGYQPIYDQATAQLKAANIPEAFWTIPDLNKLDAAGDAPSGGTLPNSPLAPGKSAGPKRVRFDERGNIIP